MPFEHRNEKELLVEGGFTLISFDKYQTGFDDETYLGERYAIHDGEQMVQFTELTCAEEMMTGLLTGTRSFGE